jgi:hypothetical protein
MSSKTSAKEFTVYVRPLVEYCSPIWSPSLLGDIDNLEAVQRRFTKRLPGLKNLEYATRLKTLGLDSLEVRRLRADLILIYKIIFGHIDISSKDFFTLNTNNLRGHKYKLFVQRSNLDIRKHFLSLRIVGPWNDLPPDKVNFSSLQTFKNSLATIDLTKYTRF